MSTTDISALVEREQPGRTDFATWDRKTLEQFAREAADANEVLHQDLKLALASWREAVADRLQGVER
jgi:hypothetical protein